MKANCWQNRNLTSPECESAMRSSLPPPPAQKREETILEPSTTELWRYIPAIAIGTVYLVICAALCDRNTRSRIITKLNSEIQPLRSTEYSTRKGRLLNQGIFVVDLPKFMDYSLPTQMLIFAYTFKYLVCLLLEWDLASLRNVWLHKNTPGEKCNNLFHKRWPAKPAQLQLRNEDVHNTPQLILNGTKHEYNQDGLRRREMFRELDDGSLV
jgi:hypothetical protein